MAIIDAHHHIWRREALPWLAGPMQPRIFGAYEPIRRDYPVSEFLADLAGSGVTKSVYVQANWADPEEEAAYVERAHAESGFPNALVAYADLLSPDIRPALDRLKRFPLLRGVRTQIHWHGNPPYRFAARPDVADDPLFRKNMAALRDYGLSFDLQVFAPQMEGAARLAHDFPEVTFILQHCGMPEDLSESGMAIWRGGMRRLSAEPNVVNKLSGLGTFIHRNDPAHIARIVGESVAIFGPERCLFGSNFPIEKIWTDYASLIAAYRAALAPFTAEEQGMMVSGTATRVYRLGDA